MYYIEKKIFSRTIRSISIKLSTNHPWVNMIQNCSNQGPDSLQRGDNYKNGGGGHLKIFSQELLSQKSMKAFRYIVYSSLFKS
jgi:hypothetical protein